MTPKEIHSFLTRTLFSRLKEHKDTVGLIIFTLDLVTRNCPVLTAADGLPYDCSSLVPCSAALAGVIVVSSNALIHVAQTSRRVILPVNGWQARVSDHGLPHLTEHEKGRCLKLEGSFAVFVDDKTLFVLLSDGSVYPVEVHADGRTVSKMTMGDAIAQTTIPAVVKRASEGHLFIGSTVGPSVLLQTVHVEEEIQDGDVDMAAPAAAVVEHHNAMDLDDDDGKQSCLVNYLGLKFAPTDLYGTSKVDDEPAQGSTTGAGTLLKKRTVVHLSLCDSIPAYGPISDITFSLARVGVRPSRVCGLRISLIWVFFQDRPVAELVAATGSGSLGGFTLFQVRSRF